MCIKSLLPLLLTLVSIRCEFLNDDACTSGRHLVLRKNESILISSPGFEERESYPPSSRCYWTITNAEKGELIEANFELLSIWSTFNCVFDGVVLFDGNSTATEILGQYCGGGIPSKKLITSGSSMHVLFYSGELSQARYQGFKLRLTSYQIPIPCNEKKEITCHNGKCVNKGLVCNYKDDCGDGTDEESCGHTVKNWLPCGKTPISPVLGNGDRVVGGQAAVRGSWPWQVSLRKKGSQPSQHLCGAVILNDLWLLSAAHCFRKYQTADLWSAQLGKYLKECDEDAEQTRYLKEIIIHPKYVGNSMKLEEANNKENDIALLRLNAPVMMKKHIQPVCLSPWRLPVKEGALCHVTGWGATLGTGNHDVLKQAEVPVVSNEMCATSYARKFNITDSMLCAGYLKGGHDSCKGDSGGPLVLSRYERWYLVGIVSTGGSCAEAMQPGVYTRVPSFYWWITSTISKRRRRGASEN